MRKLAVCFLLALLAAGLLAAAGSKRLTIEDTLAIQAVGAPKVSPDGKTVAYTLSEWDRARNRRVSHIYVVSADGGPSRKLTNGERGESAPEWSPDGARIAFLADRSVASPDRAGAPAAPEAPDTPGRARGGAQIWIIPVNGGEADKLTEGDTGVSALVWSPDAKRIAYLTRDEPKDKADREKKRRDRFDAVVVEKEYLYAHLWVIELDSKKKKRLTEGAFSVAGPQWSPDGRWIEIGRAHV